MSNVNILTLKEYWANVSNAIGTIASAKKTTGMQILGNDGTNSHAPNIDSAGNVSTKLVGSSAIKGANSTVTTAGTRVQLPDHACRKIIITANRTNTGYIYIGGSDVSSAVYGIELTENGQITLEISNSNLIYIDASVDGEGISYIAI